MGVSGEPPAPGNPAVAISARLCYKSSTIVFSGWEVQLFPIVDNLRALAQKWGGRNVLVFAYSHLAHDLTTGLFAALLAFIKIDLGIGYLESGLLLSAFTITSGLSQFLGGWIGDRFSRPRVIIFGLVGVGLTSIAISFTTEYYAILALLILLGLFAGAYHPSAVAFLSGLQGPQNRGKVLAVHMVGGSAGFALGPVLGALAAVALGWRFAFLALSVPTLLAALLVCLLFWRRSAAPGGESPRGAAAPPMPEVRISLWRAMRPMLKVIVIVVLVQLIAGSASAFLPVYLVDVHRIAPATATMLLGVMRGGGILGSLISGWLSDRWNRQNVILLAMGLTGLALLGLTNLPYGPASVVLMALFGVAMYMRGAAVQVYLMDSVPPYLRATVFGIYFGLGMEGMSLAQPVAGYFMDAYGIDSAFRSIALIATGLAVVAPLLILHWKRKKIP